MSKAFLLREVKTLNNVKTMQKVGVLMELNVPEFEITLEVGDYVRLGRFNAETWSVHYGWYAWGGNRPVCGWYLTNILTQAVKPLQYTDLEDIYIIES